MRKVRIRKLKEAFTAKFGRAPRGPQMVDVKKEGVITYMPSEKRRLKKLYLTARRYNEL